MFVVVLFAITLGVSYLSLKLGVFLCFLGLPLVQWKLPHRFGLPRWVRCLTLRRVVVNSSFLVGIRWMCILAVGSRLCLCSLILWLMHNVECWSSAQVQMYGLVASHNVLKFDSLCWRTHISKLTASDLTGTRARRRDSSPFQWTMCCLSHTKTGKYMNT